MRLTLPATVRIRILIASPGEVCRTMEIQALRVVISEEDVNAWMTEALSGHRLDVRDLRARLAAEGVYVSGVYETRIMDVHFETLWEVSAVHGQVAARLASFSPLGGAGGKAFGLANFLAKGSLRGVLMHAIADAVGQRPGLRIEDDTLTCDVDHILTQHGFSVRTNLTRIHCDPGQLTVEAGPAERLL